MKWSLSFIWFDVQQKAPKQVVPVVLATCTFYTAMISEQYIFAVSFNHLAELERKMCRIIKEGPERS